MIEFHHGRAMENEDGRTCTAYNAFNEGQLVAAKRIIQPLIQEAIDATVEKAEDEESTDED